MSRLPLDLFKILGAGALAIDIIFESNHSF
ncbi:hypothetical protein W822_04810 [Advenella kashmirensis W13003]|uniref:Uncharacterized protein n=1 Tax=Advenella kashmirensis W13003 TaxID=1424334 RepID=V8QZB3_9BURK|nr:hypothetical protein W822_04810 [Advenella kashmirensis W13003]